MLPRHCLCKANLGLTLNNGKLFLTQWSLLPLSGGYFKSLNFINFKSSQPNKGEF